MDGMGSFNINYSLLDEFELFESYGKGSDLISLDLLTQGRFQYFSDARMWTQCTPQKLDIVAAVSGLYLNNLAR